MHRNLFFANFRALTSSLLQTEQACSRDIASQVTTRFTHHCHHYILPVIFATRLNQKRKRKKREGQKEQNNSYFYIYEKKVSPRDSRGMRATGTDAVRRFSLQSVAFLWVCPFFFWQLQTRQQSSPTQKCPTQQQARLRERRTATVPPLNPPPHSAGRPLSLALP